MGSHINISYEKFPKQGDLLGKSVKVCFNYETEKLYMGKCIRDDVEEPYKTIFQLENGRVVLTTECQYTY